METKSTRTWSKIDLTIFPTDREKRLKEIYRYSYFDVSFYRSNLWMHSHRVLWILEELIPLAQKYFQFDVEKARAIALVHDDAEMITGDYQAGHKARMSKEELDAIAQEEKDALEKLASTYPKELNGYSYKELLEHSLHKDCIEAQLVSYADKIDAYCESIHELLAGNITFLRSVIFYVHALSLFSQKFPALTELLKSKESPFTYLGDVLSPYSIKVERYNGVNKPHTKESLDMETDFPFYNTWRKIVIEKGGNEGLGWLLDQKEYLK